MKDLKDRVQIHWERGVGSTRVSRCVAELGVKAEAGLDDLVAAQFPAGSERLKCILEQRLREEIVHKVRGDLVAENQRLRAAAKKWARRAMAGSASRQLVVGDWEKELEGDLQ